MKNKKFKKILLYIAQKIGELIFTGIILAVVASILSTHIWSSIEKSNRIKSQLSSLNNIYVGCSKEWFNDNFGNPQFSAIKEQYLLCAYISDYYVIQVAFDEGDSARAYLITSINNDDDVRISISDNTLVRKNAYTLGDFSYYDIDGKPESVYGFVSNGTARAFYAEEYYYMSGGNYYMYCFASLDYGKYNGDLADFIGQFCFSKDYSSNDDEICTEDIKGYQTISDRHFSCPNTYGVAENSETLELLYGYDWFNSFQLRNKLANIDRFYLN